MGHKVLEYSLVSISKAQQKHLILQRALNKHPIPKDNTNQISKFA